MSVCASPMLLSRIVHLLTTDFEFDHQSGRLLSLAGQLPVLLLVAGLSLPLVVGLARPALTGRDEATDNKKLKSIPTLAHER